MIQLIRSRKRGLCKYFCLMEQYFLDHCRYSVWILFASCWCLIYGAGRKSSKSRDWKHWLFLSPLSILYLLCSFCGLHKHQDIYIYKRNNHCSVQSVRRSFVCHTQLEKSLMRSWEEVGVVCMEVKWRKGKKKICLPKILLPKILLPKIFSLKIFFCRKYFSQKYFQKKYFYQKYFRPKNCWKK